MTYFVTGATGFIGRHLVEKLLRRDGTIFVLVRPSSLPKLEALRRSWGVDKKRVVAVTGDLEKPKLGVSSADLRKLRGRIKHLFHLGALYDIGASAESQQATNVEGTRHALQLAEAIDAQCFHYLSSIAVAGLYDGVFREDMFAEAEELDHPYFRTKHDSEKLVRQELQRPWRIYRPGIVVGHSQTGEINKIDGPYYFFKLIQKLRSLLPPWMPTIGLEGGRLNVVPVDFVVNAIDEIAHQRGEDFKCFHLTDPEPKRVGEVLNLFARAAHSPEMTMRLNARVFSFIPPGVIHAIASLAPVRRITNQVLADLGIPREILKFINYPTRFDSRETERALKGTGIAVPPLENYAHRLWDYWERNLDPDLFIDRSLSGHVRGKVVMVTGASSGIGKATALKLGEAGAKVILVARRSEKLLETQQEIAAKGATAFVYPCDLTDMESCDNLIKQALKDHGTVDILINNAGRSIRRSIAASYDRFHDFQRTMQLNYFGSLRLILGFLPTMVNQQRGHIINLSSMGVLANPPRFSAYVASKAALDTFSHCAASEFADNGIHFTTIHMPLVRTPMIAPTKLYDRMPTISPEEAADMVVQAIIYKPVRITTRLGIFAQVLHAIAPKMAHIILNTAFRMFPDSAAARGVEEGKIELTPEQVAFTQLTRGIHW
ncbi:MAG: SDR family oxidoreductase [Acidobacteria bacterium]|nr:SDR family oxidoreductase [Acidobacteriota bacterium]MBI3656489.1 SDR family oxidoreductase [Acidobacteriota bacterium]